MKFKKGNFFHDKNKRKKNSLALQDRIRGSYIYLYFGVKSKDLILEKWLSNGP